MKKEKDIANIFKNVGNQASRLEEMDWINIETKYAKRLFFSWSWRRMNVYYVGLILISFFGTLAIGTDYYLTKQKLLEGKYHQNHSSIQFFDKDSMSAKKKAPVSIAKIKSQDTTPTQKDTDHTKIEKDKITKREKLVEDSPSKIISTDSLDLQETTLTLDSINEIKPLLSVDTIKKKNLVSVPKDKEPETLEPVIIYVQDTIIQLDSTEVSARKMRKINK